MGGGTRSFGAKRSADAPQDDIVTFAGASPLHSAKQVRTQLFDCFLCTLTYRFLESRFVSSLIAFAVVLLVFITQKESQKRFPIAQTSDFQKVFAFESKKSLIFI